MNVILISLLTPAQMQWLDFTIFSGAFALVAVATLVWHFRFRNKKIRRRKHRRDGRRPKLTLAQTGGLPPVRQPENPPAKIPPPQ